MPSPNNTCDNSDNVKSIIDRCVPAVVNSGSAKSVVLVKLPEDVGPVDLDVLNSVCRQIRKMLSGTCLEGARVLAFPGGTDVTVFNSEEELAIERAKQLRESKS